jgi:hypothetical protein
MCHIACYGQFSTAYRATCAWAVATLAPILPNYVTGFT